MDKKKSSMLFETFETFWKKVEKALYIIKYKIQFIVPND